MPCLTTFTSENTLPPDRNRYLVLYLNFSGIVGELHNYRKRLDAHCGTTFENFCKIYADYLPQDTVDELIEIINHHAQLKYGSLLRQELYSTRQSTQGSPTPTTL